MSWWFWIRLDNLHHCAHNELAINAPSFQTIATSWNMCKHILIIIWNSILCIDWTRNQFNFVSSSRYNAIWLTCVETDCYCSCLSMQNPKSWHFQLKSLPWLGCKSVLLSHRTLIPMIIQICHSLRTTICIMYHYQTRLTSNEWINTRWNTLWYFRFSFEISNRLINFVNFVITPVQLVITICWLSAQTALCNVNWVLWANESTNPRCLASNHTDINFFIFAGHAARNVSLCSSLLLPAILPSIVRSIRSQVDCVRVDRCNTAKSVVEADNVPRQTRLK